MKTFTKILSAVGLGAALTFTGPVISSASAQDGATAEAPDRDRRGHRAHRGRRGHRRHAHMRRVFRQLDLSEDQQAQMRAIRQSARQRAQQLRGSGDRDAMRALHRSTREQIRSVLTPAQQQQAQALRQQMARQHLDRRIARMTERLELSPTQAQQVTGILRHAQSQRQAIFEQARLDETSPREALEALRANTRSQLRSVLTDAQQTQLEEARERRGRRGRR